MAIGTARQGLSLTRYHSVCMMHNTTCTLCVLTCRVKTFATYCRAAVEHLQHERPYCGEYEWALRARMLAHAVSGSSGSVCDKLHLPFVADNSRSTSRSGSSCRRMSSVWVVGLHVTTLSLIAMHTVTWNLCVLACRVATIRGHWKAAGGACKAQESAQR